METQFEKICHLHLFFGDPFVSTIVDATFGTAFSQITAQNCLFKILDEKRKSLRLTEEELNENSRLRKDRMFDYRRSVDKTNTGDDIARL